MFSIGDFARHGQVPVRMLRLAERVDPAVRVGAAARLDADDSARSRLVTGPASPLPTTHSVSAPRTAATGVMTAAVPQAKTSVISPDSQPARHSSTEILPS